MGRVLVVDDDQSTVTAMTALLREDGYEVGGQADQV
jgi:CheY-like chemotaxis protein